MKRKLIILMANAFALIIVHLLYFNMNITMPLETEIIGMIGKIQKHYAGEGRFKDSGYVFINTAYDNALLNLESDEGDNINIVITDRILLSKFFQKMADHNNQHRFILCDLVFDKPSSNDSLLQAHINRVSKIILPEHSTLGEEQKTVYFNQDYALAEYTTYEGKVSKVKLYSPEHHAKTLPLAMYEAYNPEAKMNINSTGLWLKGNFAPFSIYPRYFYTQENIKNHEIRLGKVVQMLEMNDSLFYSSVLKDKIIVIGNFASDMHLTPIGQYLPGSLVLFNTFLTLQDNYHLHNWAWFIFLFVCFFLLSYFAIYLHDSKTHHGPWHRILHFLGISGICLLISLLSAFLFGLHTTILPVILYFETLLFLRKLYKSRPITLKRKQVFVKLKRAV